MSETDATLAHQSGFDRPLHDAQERQAVETTGLRERFHGHHRWARTIAVLLMVLLAAGSARWYLSARRTGWIELTTAGPPLMAQVLGEISDDPVSEPFPVVSRVTLALPEGDYRLRVHGVGRLGRTYRLAVNAGETQAHVLSLDEGRLLGGEPVQQFGGQRGPRQEPIPFAPATAALELKPGKADLIEWTGKSVIRRDGQTGEPVWDTGQPGIPWRADEQGAARLRRWLEYGPAPELVKSAPDLDGDGVGDVIWFSRQMSSLLALSGLNGSVVWEHRFGLDTPGVIRSDDPKLPGPLYLPSRNSWVVDAPVVADLDRDGTPDLVATVAFYELPSETEQRSPSPPAGVYMPMGRNRQPYARRVIQAVAGRTGQRLWEVPIDATFTAVSYPDWNWPGTLVPGNKVQTIGYVDGERWIGLDAATGKPRGVPINLGFRPVRPVQYAELDGNETPEIVAMGPGQTAQQYTLAAFTLATGQNLWVAAVNGKDGFPFNPAGTPFWPFVVDLYGDGLAELVVPDSGPMARTDGYRGIRVINGQTGQTRWVRPMRPENNGQDGLLQILDAPDLDHDGVRDLITSSFFLGRYLTTNHNGTPPVPERMYVDALSGKDGRPLWWWHRDNATDRSVALGRLRWWGRGPDGWPLLAVPVGPTGGDAPPIVLNLEASTGRVATSALGLNNHGVADFDGDGLDDLWGEAGGQLHAFRGETPELWRALGGFGPARGLMRQPANVVQPAADFNGDGIADTLIAGPRAPIRTSIDSIAAHAMGPAGDHGFRQAGEAVSPPPGGRTVIARSGRDGRALWKTELDPERIWYERDRGEYYHLTPLSLPDGDLDGDGIPDILVQKYVQLPGKLEIKTAATLPLQVVSGRAGDRLWTTGPLPLGYEAFGYSVIQWASARVVEPGGAPDMFVRHISPFVPGRPTAAAGGVAKPRLARISGRDGQVVWDIPLSDEQESNHPGGFPAHEFGDLDGDGVLDLVTVLHGAPGTNHPNHELRAISLRDGRLHWSAQLDYANPFRAVPQLAVADLDGDERPEVVVTEVPADGDKTAFALKALNGADGTIRWTWNSGAPEVPNVQVWGWLALGKFGPDGRRTVCLHFTDPRGLHRILVFDEYGHERSRRELPGDGANFVNFADVDGDKRDEVLVRYGENLHVWTSDLEERWSFRWVGQWNAAAQVILASSKKPGIVIIPPSLGLDGSNGRPRWTGSSPRSSTWSIVTTSLLDPGHSSRPPSFLSGAPGATVCRSALPTTSNGEYAPPRGARVPPGLARDDPRWTRPLPWTIGPAHDVVGSPLFAMAGLALFNVFLPLVVLRLVALRRPWTMRLLMMLPVAAALPLTAFSVVEPLVPALPAPYPASTRTVFFMGSLAGVPIVSYAATAVWLLLRRRWTRLGLLATLTVVAALAIALIWLWIDIRSMPATERYASSGWYFTVIAGAYATGALLSLAFAIPARVRTRIFSRNRPGHA